MKKKVSLVQIVWSDAFSNSGWMGKEEFNEWHKTKDWLVTNVGWLVEQNSKYFVIASRWSPTQKLYGEFQKIPKTWCKIYPLKEANWSFKT